MKIAVDGCAYADASDAPTRACVSSSPLLARYRSLAVPPPPVTQLRYMRNETPNRVMATNEELVLTADQQRYIDWLCTAPSERNPSTAEEFAAMIGVNSSTLRRWKKKDNFITQWESQSKNHQGSPERTQGVLDAMFAKAVDGDVRAAQLWLQAMNKMAPAQVEVKHDKSASQLSDEELDELIATLAAHEQSERRHLKAM